VHDKGLDELMHLLSQGRLDFANSGYTSGVAEWQCLHVQRWVGVEWLHLHTFNGMVRGEQLPDVAYPHNPRHALCVGGNTDVKVSAQWILDNIPMNSGVLKSYEELQGDEGAPAGVSFV